MRYYFVVFILFFLPLQKTITQNSKIVSFEELKFTSDFEKNAFLKLNTDEENLFMLFVAIDPEVNENIFQEFQIIFKDEQTRLLTKKFTRSGPEKKIKILYDYVNTQVLTVYQEKILFPHLFVNGKFNCLTASAFYGFLMDSLQIDYHFRESSNHVLPVAFPDSYKIKIETTDRIYGVEYYNEKLKTEFVHYLLSNHLITQEDYNSKKSSELFNEFFLPGAGIGLKELAGLHYMNDALYKWDAGKPFEAFELIKKAYYIYPSMKMEAIFRFIHFNLLSINDFLNPDHDMLLVYLSRFPHDIVRAQETEALFINISDYILFINSEKDRYDELYTFLNEQMAEGKVKDAVLFQYFFLRGKSLLAEYKFKEGLDFLLKAYTYRKKNMELQSLIISAFAATFDNTSGEKLVEKFESFAKNNPLLAENGKFISLRLMALLIATEEYFSLEDEGNGLKVLNMFEKLFQSNPDVQFDHEFVGEAYTAASVYYFKKYNNQKAIQYLKKGLEITPDNFELKYRLRSITGE